MFTDVEASLREIRSVLDDDEAGDRKLHEVAGKQSVPAQPAVIAELRRDLEKYLEAHEKASFTNTELHRAMNLHISNLRLLGGPLDTLREALPRPQLSEGTSLKKCISPLWNGGLLINFHASGKCFNLLAFFQMK